MEITTNIIKQFTTRTNVDSYIDEDGLPHCKVCGDLLVTKNVVPILNKRMPVICRCTLEEMEKEKKLQEKMQKDQALLKLRKASLLGERYKATTFESTSITGDSFEIAFRRCRKYCEISLEALRNGYGMYIYGSSGVGKTHLTACMCNELIKQYRQCLFTNFFEISKLIRSTFSRNEESEETIRRICNVDFLFLDDLGTERLKKGNEDSWLQEQVYDIINKRYNNKKPTIFTSNYSLNELIVDRGMMEKTVDRIMEMSTAIIKVSGNSYRANNKPKKAPF